MNSALEVARNLTTEHNVAINVYDEITGQLIQHHEGHNAATNSLLQGIGHYLIGDGTLNQGFDFLDHWIPMYISLGTMGLYNQEVDEEGLPIGIGYSPDATEVDNFTHYMKYTPGFGADGYDPNENPGYNAVDEKDYNRDYPGIGPMFEDRPATELVELIPTASNTRIYYTQNDIDSVIKVQLISSGSTVTKTVTLDPNNKRKFSFSSNPGSGKTIEITYTSYLTTNCELISDTFSRAKISYRKIVPEEYAELPKTIDVVFSAMISTGALKQFREPGKDYVLITEAGLWSKNNWPKDENGNVDYSTGDNGLLAGYRIYPPDSHQQDMTVPENRKILKQQILRVGYNQVVQVVWKIQLGSVNELVNYINVPIRWEGF